LGPKDVKLFKDLYTDNKTKVTLQNWETEWLQSETGIKQGCNISPYLFIIYLHDLTTQLIESGHGIEMGETTLPALLYADDIILLANNSDTLQKQLDILTQYGSENNMTYSTPKCQIMAYNITHKPALTLSQGVLEYTEEYTYLGVTLTTEKNPFKTHIQKTKQKAKRFEGLIRSIAHRSCNKPWVGRHLWKSVAVPALTYANEIIQYNKTDHKTLDQSQNAVGKSVLGGNWLTAHAAVTADMGWSNFQTREHKNKLKYHGRLLNQDGNRLSAKANLHYITRWHTTLSNLYKKYEDRNNPFPAHNITKWEKATTQAVARAYTQEWKDTLKNKTSLGFYQNMDTPSQKDIYDGTYGSELLFKARTNSWPIGHRTHKWEGGNGHCRQCNMGEMENITHLLINCPAYTDQRDTLIEQIMPTLTDRYPHWDEIEPKQKTQILLGFGHTDTTLLNSVKHYLTEIHGIRFPTYTR
jgi:hypothetical protein